VLVEAAVLAICVVLALPMVAAVVSQRTHGCD
jgi:hypothetical protein